MSLRFWCSVVTYPVVTLGAALSAWAMVRSGLRGEAAVALVFLALVVLVQLLERHLTFEPGWNEPRGDVGADVLHFLFSTVGVFAFFQAVVTRWLPLSGSRWPHHWPLVAQVVLALLVGELGAYWIHRAMHSGGWLWLLHRLHHSAPRLYAGNASRNHPLDSLLVLVAFALPLLWLGAGPEVLTTVGAFSLAHLTLQHANIELRLGPLNWLVAGPELHRWHHSRVEVEANTNYGHVLVVWDVLFRSRRLDPTRRPPAEVGLFGEEVMPSSFSGQLRAGFVREERK